MLKMVLASAVMALGLIVAGGASAAEINLRIGHILATESPTHRAQELLARRVLENSRGQVEIKIFPAAQLGPINVMLESLQTGSLDMLTDLLEWYGNWDKNFAVFGLPYLFRDRAHLQKYLETDRFKKSLKDLGDQRGLVFLSDTVNWHMMSDRTLLTKKPINSPADVRGLKLRMFQARVPILSWQTLGANTVVIPWGEVYSALSTGVVEAVTGQIESHYLAKQTEVAKFLTITEEYYQVYMPVMSAKTAAKLTPQQMSIIRAAAKEAGDFWTKDTADAQETYKTRAEAAGVRVTRQNIAPWREAIKPAHDKLIEEGIVPKDLVEFIRAL